jgi:hypothetical protein
VNKDKFLSYIKNPEEMSEDDISVLEEFVSKYPFCQLGHLFLAKITHDNNKPDKTLKLNHAALYTVNRAILKRIIEDGWHVSPQVINQPFAPTSQLRISEEDKMTEAPFTNEAPQASTTSQQEPGEQNQEIRDEIESRDSTENDSTVTEATPPSEPQYSDVANQIIKAIEENRQLRKQFEEKDSGSPGMTKNPDENNNKIKDGEVISNYSMKPDDIVKEASEKGERKKKKQIEIIDNFISHESALVKRKLKIPEGSSALQEDLSLKSSSLNDDLVSENLALIMKNQGKVDLAIDIYKKLIWKFPQKKAYFASLIEELKK